MGMGKGMGGTCQTCALPAAILALALAFVLAGPLPVRGDVAEGEAATPFPPHMLWPWPRSLDAAEAPGPKSPGAGGAWATLAYPLQLKVLPPRAAEASTVSRVLCLPSTPHTPVLLLPFPSFGGERTRLLDPND